MKLWIPFAAALLLASPVQASNPMLNKIPEALLMEGVVKISSCLMVDTMAVNKLREILKADGDEPTQQDHNLEMMKQAEELLTEMSAYSRIGRAMIDTLIDHYHHTAVEMKDKLQKIIDVSKTELTEDFADVDSYQELQEKVEPKRNECNTVLGDWRNQVKTHLDK